MQLGTLQAMQLGTLLAMQDMPLQAIQAGTLLAMQDMPLQAMQAGTLRAMQAMPLRAMQAMPLQIQLDILLRTPQEVTLLMQVVAMVLVVVSLRITTQGTWEGHHQTRTWEGFNKIQDGRTMLPVEMCQAGIWEDHLVGTHILGEITADFSSQCR